MIVIVVMIIIMMMVMVMIVYVQKYNLIALMPMRSAMAMMLLLVRSLLLLIRVRPERIARPMLGLMILAAVVINIMEQLRRAFVFIQSHTASFPVSLRVIERRNSERPELRREWFLLRFRRQIRFLRFVCRFHFRR